ncbi:MAG TPA: phospholipase D-like domain-containing protein [Desulfobacteria bacterium]|nr:phospholipase D-like domain-containing protein [Desulfobacteria bacterium]
MRKKAVEICIVVAFVFAFLSLFSFALIVTHEAVAQSPDNGAQAHVIIAELYPNTAMRNEPDEYVVLTNPCAHSVNLEGWSITDTEGTLVFPSFDLAPNQTVYVTRNASAFMEQMSTLMRDVTKPDFEYGADSDSSVPRLQTTGRTFALRNTGDEVILQDESGKEVDVVLFGEAVYDGAGWRAEPLEKPREGTIFVRKGAQDTNRYGDWLTLPLGASYHAPVKFACSGSDSATAFVSPDCSFSVLQEELESASSSLYINLYEFDNPYLTGSIIDALNRGVNVQLLLEGSPVGGITNEERYIAETIAKNGGDVRYSRDSYLNHAKYAVIDNRALVVMTDNWKTTGVPTNNSFGNRGWGIVLRNEDMAKYFTDVFIEDFYRGQEFVSEMDGTEAETITRTIPQGVYVPVFEPRTVTCDFTVIPVLAPDTALSNATILGAIQNAQESVYVQQFSAGRFWGDGDNTFVAALIEAARRGCEVKVLLDSKDYSVEGSNDNDEVVAWLERVASEENLTLYAELADLDALGLAKIHTKGLVVDGEIVVIASLNWNPNSAHNREAGVIVENEDIASFFTAVFLHDWNASVRGGQGEAPVGEAAARDGKTPVKMKLVGVAVTLILSFVIFRIVKWYKRV